MAPTLATSRWSGGVWESQDTFTSSAGTIPTSSQANQAGRHRKRILEQVVIVSKALACLSLSQDERSAWAAVKDHIKEPERVTTRLPELQQIREDLRELTATVSKLLSVKSISWAQVAANQSACVTKSLPRKAREVLVTCSLSDAEGRAKTAAEVVRSIRSQPGGDSLITGARKLPSGAFALTFKSIEAKRA